MSHHQHHPQHPQQQQLLHHALNASDSVDLDEEELQLLYTYVDSIPLSRPKKNIARDFSDAVLMAEMVKYYYPKLIDIHNYSAASSVKQKMYNWNTLNQKAFKKMQFSVSKEEIEAIVKCVPGAIERLLKQFQIKVTMLQQQGFDPTVIVGRTDKSKSPVNLPPQPQPPSLAAKRAVGGAALGGRIAGGFRQQQQQQQRGRNNRLDHELDELDQEIDQEYDDVPGSQYANLHLHQHNSHYDVVSRHQSKVDEQQLVEKDTKIQELQETVKLLEQKVNKLNLLVRLKESKIVALTAKLKDAGLLR